MGKGNRTFPILAAALAAAAVLGGCVVYETAPGVYSPAPPSSFDRSWSAALGAFADEGVQIVQQDRSPGAIRGRAGDVGVSADVRQQADGSVRVEFGVSGNVAANPSLKDRVVGSYNRRMGR